MTDDAGREIVFAVYTPKEGQGDALLDLVRGHAPLLREKGLATDREVTVARAGSDGTLIEIFEWTNAAAAQQAHEDPDVQSLWNAMEAVADFRTLADLEESRNPFPHFEPVDVTRV